jgi:hypothetical protein
VTKNSEEKDINKNKRKYQWQVSFQDEEHKTEEGTADDE